MAVSNTVKREIPPTHPGEMLREDFMPDYGLSAASLASALGISRQTVNEWLRERRPLTPVTALRLEAATEDLASPLLEKKNALKRQHRKFTFQFKALPSTLFLPLRIAAQPAKLEPMHELAITENILNIVVDHAIQANASRVISLKLKIGQLSSFVDDSVQFCWNLLSQGTICAGAELQIVRIAAEFECLDCGQRFPFERELAPCPGCGGMRARLNAGEELEVSSIEIEKE